jgi:hypothetical protein
MRAMPRTPRVAFAIFTCALVLGCEAPPEGWFPPAFVDEGEFDARRLAYLEFATGTLATGSPLSAIAHMEREALDPAYVAPAGAFGPDAWDASFTKLSTFEDTSDFDMLYLMNAWLGYNGHPAVSAELWQKVEDAVLRFKFWYSQPTPPGIIDDMWYWSENHQIIFHTLEYLAGQSFPDCYFSTTRMWGSQHRNRARERILRWLERKARFGFAEWHSNVYYQKDVTPLLTLVEYAEDPEIAEKAAMLLDRVLLDIALHSFRGAFGVTHGRTYKKDKMTALHEDTFGLAKLLFDQAEYPYPSPTDPGATLLARAKKYRLPQAILDVAQSPGPFADRERMGIPLDEFAPISDDYPPPYGYRFLEENIDVWWEMSALTAWQVLPIVWDVGDRYNLWATELFQPFVPLRESLPSLEFAQAAALGLAHAAAGGLNEQVDTYTFRTADYMLSTAQDHRKGSRGWQYHSWQATFDPNAQVFTTHPGEPPRQTLDWSDDGEPGSWTGTASQPRSAQIENVAIHLYAPQYAQAPGVFEPLTRYEPYTHAYFPQDHFDEVVRDGHWTFGRFREGYLALYSWRLPRFVDHGPTVAANGMALPFDLVADGAPAGGGPAPGPDNAWIVECGRQADWGSFDAFRAAIASAALTINPVVTGLPPRARPPFFEVAYASPSQGQMAFSWTGPFVVDGVEVPISGYARYDNPWVHEPFEAKGLFLFDAATRNGLGHDFERARRMTFHAE